VAGRAFVLALRVHVFKVSRLQLLHLPQGQPMPIMPILLIAPEHFAALSTRFDHFVFERQGRFEIEALDR
jgi:hypothetical protein